MTAFAKSGFHEGSTPHWAMHRAFGLELAFISLWRRAADPGKRSKTPLNALTSTMKRDAVLINVGRGGTLDETALSGALRDGRLGGAALDVFQCALPGDHPLLTLPNFIGTPHVAAQTQDAQEHVGWSVVRIIDAFALGEDWSAHGVVVASTRRLFPRSN